MSVLGATDIQQRIKNIRKQLNSTGLRAVAMAGAQPIAETAAQLVSRGVHAVSRRTGTAASGSDLGNIIIERRRGSVGVGIANVGYRKEAFYLGFFETGTKAHSIVAHEITRIRSVGSFNGVKLKKRDAAISSRRKKRKALSFIAGGQQLLRASVKHPGQRRTPFLTAALYQRQNDAEAAMLKELDVQLEKALNKTGGITE